MSVRASRAAANLALCLLRAASSAMLSFPFSVSSYLTTPSPRLAPEKHYFPLVRAQCTGFVAAHASERLHMPACKSASGARLLGLV